MADRCSWWSIPTINSVRAWDSHRNIFRIPNAEYRGRSTGVVSSYYRLSETDADYAPRMARIAGLKPSAAAPAGAVSAATAKPAWQRS
jgi:hypothetical protein